jgi:hypothetical protein
LGFDGVPAGRFARAEVNPLEELTRIVVPEVSEGLKISFT